MIAEKVIVSIIVVAQLIKEKLFYHLNETGKNIKEEGARFFCKKK